MLASIPVFTTTANNNDNTGGVNALFVSQFATVEVGITFLKDEFGPKVVRYLKREELLTLVVCIVAFILGIPHVTKVCRSNTL